jgi:hypothetical protein
MGRERTVDPRAGAVTFATPSVEHASGNRIKPDSWEAEHLSPNLTDADDLGLAIAVATEASAELH